MNAEVGTWGARAEQRGWGYGQDLQGSPSLWRWDPNPSDVDSYLSWPQTSNRGNDSLTFAQWCFLTEFWINPPWKSLRIVALKKKKNHQEPCQGQRMPLRGHLLRTVQKEGSEVFLRGYLTEGSQAGAIAGFFCRGNKAYYLVPSRECFLHQDKRVLGKMPGKWCIANIFFSL